MRVERTRRWPLRQEPDDGFVRRTVECGPVNRPRVALTAHAPIFLFFVAFTGAACSGDTEGLGGDSGVAPSCANDDGCPSDQYCNGGICVVGTGNECTLDSECAAGEECKIVTQCGGATRCHGNTCEPKLCADNTDCPDGFTCGVDGMCTMTQMMACTEDDDCTAANTVCVGGMCVAAIECEDSTDCPSDQRCIEDVCNDPCTMNSDCGSAIYACDVPSGECIQRCNNDGVCPMGTICESFLCVAAECAMDADCTGTGTIECQGEENGHGRCVEIIACNAPGGCPPGTACNTATNICEELPECVGDRDCENDSYCEGGFCQPSVSCTNASCEPGYDCVGGVCVPELCRGDADCPLAGEACISGTCQTPPAPTFVTQVRILTPAGVVRPGTTYSFVAVALDQAGAVVPGVVFAWESTQQGVATIDADGVATGGMTAGTTVITASMNNGTSTIVSPGVNLVNLGELDPNSVRVSIVSGSSGSPINGAAVDLSGAFGTLSAVTTANGVAVFDTVPASAVFSVTAGQTNFDFVSVVGIDARDLLIALPPVSKPTQSGGLRGTVDFARVTAMGQLSISLNGASLPSPLVSFQPAALFGGDQYVVNVPQANINIPVPMGSTLEVDFLGNPIPLKDQYYTRAATGIRAGWSFAGRIGLDAIMGAGAGGNIVGTILPYLQRFTHGVRPVVDVVALPTIVDGNDIDNDGDTAETVPNYGQFPSVALTPDTAQSLRYNLAVANLPFVSGGNANTLLVVGGMLLPSVGFVPLGLDGLQDDAGNGIVAPFTTKIAPPHGGLEVGEYAVLATAIRLEGAALPGPGSARLLVSDRLPEDVDLSDGWMDSPLNASWNANLREVSLPPIAAADLYRIAFASDDGTWHIYAPAPMSVNDAVVIPGAPMGLIDRTGTTTVTVDAIDLESGASASTIFDVANGNALSLDRVTRGFARASIVP